MRALGPPKPGAYRLLSSLRRRSMRVVLALDREAPGVAGLPPALGN